MEEIGTVGPHSLSAGCDFWIHPSAAYLKEHSESVVLGSYRCSEEASSADQRRLLLLLPCLFTGPQVLPPGQQIPTSLCVSVLLVQEAT